jgi:hypothetical protein
VRARREHGQQKTGQHEPAGQDRGQPSQEIGRAARRHEISEAPASAASHAAESAPFRALHEDDRDKRDREYEMNNEDDCLHRTFSIDSLAALLQEL